MGTRGPPLCRADRERKSKALALQLFAHLKRILRLGRLRLRGPCGAQLIREFNQARPHQGRWCFGKTPMQTFLDAMPIAKEKMIAA